MPDQGNGIAGLGVTFNETIYCTNFNALNLHAMPFIDFNAIQRLRIWDNIHGALYHSDNMTFGHITLEEGAVLPEHHHVQEQWTHVLDGSLEFTLDGETKVMTPGISVYIPSNVRHSAKALSRCKVMDAFLPCREDFKTLEPWIVAEQYQ
jgi:quercetin dioxygenase-like cupin family protein